MKGKHIRCWHFVAQDKRLRWGSRAVVEEGKTYRVKGPLVMCEKGLHGSRSLIDALQYAPGTWICLVEIWGDVQEQPDKLVGRNRKVLRMIDGARLLHEFACDVAEIALKRAKVKDKRCWAAIEIKRKWLDGKATDEELAAARDAAWDAASAAASAAAWDAARAAARAAAWDAARAAARDAARAAARAEFNTLLTKRVEEAMA